MPSYTLYRFSGRGYFRTLSMPPYTLYRFSGRGEGPAAEPWEG
ncbi:MAG TPA: hypothetical protein VEH84_06050 [Alphaproteobacteria bacterium]|nr:hypothetical protein [Alphaproteobacteria bacterium]